MTAKTSTLVTEERPKQELQLFREFEHSLLDMERRMDRIVRDVFGERELPFPLLQGLALSKDADGTLRFAPFGHLQESLDKFMEGWRQPVLFWTVGEGGKTIVFHAELPGIRKQDIKAEVTGEALNVEAESGTTKYRAQCVPGYALQADSAEARYSDGVLTVSCRLAEPNGPKTRKLQVR